MSSGTSQVGLDDEKDDDAQKVDYGSKVCPEKAKDGKTIRQHLKDVNLSSRGLTEVISYFQRGVNLTQRLESMLPTPWRCTSPTSYSLTSLLTHGGGDGPPVHYAV